MIGPLFNLVPLLLGGALIVVWIHALVNWDGQRHCDRNCDACPFPKTHECQDGERRKDK